MPPAPVRARRRFGQNFLIDEEIIAQIVTLLNPQAGEHLIEIGPGWGALTRPVLARAGKLLAIEIDRDLAARLRSDRRLRQSGALTVITGDALSTDFTAFAREQKLRIFGNLPYNISSPLLFHLLTGAGARSCISDLTFMLQQEVALRLCAAPGSRAYGRLTVMAHFCATCTPLLTIAPAAFAPRPQVTSQLVRLVPRNLSVAQWALYPFLSRLTITAFSARRKFVGNALSGLLSSAELRQVGAEPQLRPDCITPEQYCGLAVILRDKDPGAA